MGFAYHGSDRQALLGLDIQVEAGEIVLLAGPSGGGKSTAAKGLAGLLGDIVPGRVEGRVLFDGVDVSRGLEVGSIALVQQDPESHLCTLTVQDEVAFGPENLLLPPEDVRARLDAALGQVGARHLIGRSTSELSGGEKQRVAIASMLAMGPRALVLDEPTANLDPPARAEVLKVLLELPRRLGAPVVVAEHRLDALWGRAREVVALDGGSGRWRGGPKDLADQAEGLSMAGVRIPDRPDLLGLERSTVGTGREVLRVRCLVAGYGEREVLRGAELDVRAGELVGLVGPNGGGKTTLLRCALGLVAPWDGLVEVAGVEAVGRPTSELARHAGLVFQSPDHQLFATTVRGELEFSPRCMGVLGPEARSRIASLARGYGLEGLMDAHPFRLSHGQKRRVNIASVQSSGPHLLMLDEPFIGQDIVNIRIINARLQEAKAAGAGVLVVSHDLEALSAMADRAFALVDGVAEEVDDVGGLSRVAEGWRSGK